MDRIFPGGAGDAAPVSIPRCAAGGRRKGLPGTCAIVFVSNNVYRMEGFNLGSRESLSGGQLCLGVAQYRMGRWGMVRLAFRALFGRIHNERDLDTLIAKEILHHQPA